MQDQPSSFTSGFAEGHSHTLETPLRSNRPLSASASTLRRRPSYHSQDAKAHQRHSRHKSASYVTSSAAPGMLKLSPGPLKRNGSSGQLHGGSTVASPPLANRPAQTHAQRRRRANLLRVRIERGLMVGMGLLAGYRMMTLDYSFLQHLWQDQDGLDLTSSESALSRNWPSPVAAPPVSPSCSSSHAASSTSPYSWREHQQRQYLSESLPVLSRSSWALGAGMRNDFNNNGSGLSGQGGRKEALAASLGVSIQPSACPPQSSCTAKRNCQARGRTKERTLGGN